MVTNSLKSKTIKGVAWNTIENFSSLGIQFLIGVILARLLSPSEYGIIGLITVFLAVSEAFITAGFGSALIRKTDRTEADMATVFTFSVITSIVFYGILFLTAPLIAGFYNQPLLIPITRVLGLGLILGAFCIVPNVVFTSAIDFKTTTKVSLVAGVSGGIVAICLAYWGFGVWALVFNMLSNNLVRTIMLWFLSKWRPKEKFSYEAFRSLFSYGSKLMISGLLNALYNNLYTIIIGKLFAPSTLGLYTRASSFANLPSQNLTNVIQRVTFPVLSTIQNDDERLTSIYRRMLKMSAFVIFPLMMLLFGISDPLVRWLLTDKWDGCIILLQLLCFSMMWYPIHAINLNLLQVKGRSDLFLKLEIIKKVLGTIIVIVASFQGIVGLCIGGIVSSLISLIINTYYTGKIIGIGFIRQMQDVFPIFIISAIGGVIVVLLMNLNLNSNLLRLIIGSLVFALYYGIMSFAFLKEEFKEAKDLIIRKK